VTEEAQESWAVVEVMGHRFHAGKISEQIVAGGGFLKVEALTVGATDGEEHWTTVLYAPSALFSIRPGTEESVRKQAPRFYPSSDGALALDPARYPIDEDLDDGDDEEPF
jgi:hypothetical protein